MYVSVAFGVVGSLNSMQNLDREIKVGFTFTLSLRGSNINNVLVAADGSPRLADFEFNPVFPYQTGAVVGQPQSSSSSTKIKSYNVPPNPVIYMRLSVSCFRCYMANYSTG
ncbi:hypothetical protein BDR07DRAFT_1372466 [Suillus spraguei]|nr:hypothetical protein BDR07DRAFT_1372466 [Suillus spraguei]